MYVRNPLLRVDKNDTYWQASRISRVFWSGMLTLARQTCAPSRLHCPRTLSYHRKKSNYVMSYKISRMINLTNLWRNHSTNRILNVNKEDGKHNSEIWNLAYIKLHVAGQHTPSTDVHVIYLGSAQGYVSGRSRYITVVY